MFNRKKFFIKIISFIVMFSIFTTFLFLVVEINHIHTHGSDHNHNHEKSNCSTCKHFNKLNNNLKFIFSGFNYSALFLLIIYIFKYPNNVFNLFIYSDTLVNKKVKMNN